MTSTRYQIVRHPFPYAEKSRETNHYHAPCRYHHHRHARRQGSPRTPESAGSSRTGGKHSSGSSLSTHHKHRHDRRQQNQKHGSEHHRSGLSVGSEEDPNTPSTSTSSVDANSSNDSTTRHRTDPTNPATNPATNPTYLSRAATRPMEGTMPLRGYYLGPLVDSRFDMLMLREPAPNPADPTLYVNRARDKVAERKAWRARGGGGGDPRRDEVDKGDRDPLKDNRMGGKSSGRSSLPPSVPFPAGVIGECVHFQRGCDPVRTAPDLSGPTWSHACHVMRMEVSSGSFPLPSVFNSGSWEFQSILPRGPLSSSLSSCS